jgi:hypothetical protein
MKDRLTEEQKQLENEKYADSFFLFKHSVKLPSPVADTPSGELDFFTLYTNIIPHILPANAGFSRPGAVRDAIPFYQKYCFRVSPTPSREHPYAVRNGKKIFAGSYCTVKDKDEETYCCNFHNFDDKTLWIDVPKREITLRSGDPTYRPQGANIPFYDKKMAEADTRDDKKRDVFKKGTLKTSAYFQKYVNKCYPGYFQVKVFKDEVTEAGLITEDTDVIVQESDLEWEAEAYLNTGNSVCTDKVAGVMVYDTPGGNARDILEANREFELADSVQFLADYGKDKQYGKMQAGNGGAAPGYLYIEKRGGNSNGEEDIEVKIAYDREYTYNETMIPEKTIPLTMDTPLGYPIRPPAYLSKYLEVSLLFKDTTFMKEQYRVDAYVIPPGTMLYDLREGSEEGVFVESYPSYHQMIIKEKEQPVLGKDSSGYAGFKYDGKLFYLPERAAEGYKRNILEWEAFFKILDTGYEEQGQEDDRTITKLYTLAKEKLVDALKKFLGDESDHDGDIIYDGNPGWKQETAYDESRATRELKRTMVCCHPMEWDKTLYYDKETIRPMIVNKFGVWREPERREHFKKQIEAIDIWEGLKGKGIAGLNMEMNNFWFAHPIYFINHLYRGGLFELSRVEELERIQDAVMALECLKQGHEGIYRIGKIGETFCNHAVYVTIRAVDKNFNNFTNREGTTFPEYNNNEAGVLEDYAPSSYNYRKSNYWCHVLKQQATRSDLSGIVEVDAKKAQEYGNQGYVVIGAWPDLTGPNKSPHFVTVRPKPGRQYNPLSGPTVAHVGASPNEERTAQMAYGGGEKWKDVHWYYNQKQQFIFDFSYINELKQRR